MDNLRSLKTPSYKIKKFIMSAKVKFVYVLDMNGNPLMPTRRFGKVRRMLRDGLAKVVRRDIFTIQLLYEPKTHVVDELALGCDTIKK